MSEDRRARRAEIFRKWAERHPDTVTPDAEFRMDVGWLVLLQRAVARVGTYPKTWGVKIRGGKEKFGCLVLHVAADYDVPGCRSEVVRLREEIRLMSLAHCEICGDAGRLRLGSYAKTICDEHAASTMEGFQEDDGVFADPWEWGTDREN